MSTQAPLPLRLVTTAAYNTGVFTEGTPQTGYRTYVRGGRIDWCGVRCKSREEAVVNHAALCRSVRLGYLGLRSLEKE